MCHFVSRLLFLDRSPFFFLTRTHCVSAGLHCNLHSFAVARACHFVSWRPAKTKAGWSGTTPNSFASTNISYTFLIPRQRNKFRWEVSHSQNKQKVTCKMTSCATAKDWKLKLETGPFNLHSFAVAQIHLSVLFWRRDQKRVEVQASSSVLFRGDFWLKCDGCQCQTRHDCSMLGAVVETELVWRRTCSNRMWSLHISLQVSRRHSGIHHQRALFDKARQMEGLCQGVSHWQW